MGRVRRTKEEIEAGKPQEFKANGGTLEEWRAQLGSDSGRMPADEPNESAPPQELPESGKKQYEMSRLPRMINDYVMQYHKVRDEDGNETHVEEFLGKLKNKKVDWTSVMLDEKFTIEGLHNLSKQGYVYAFSINWPKISGSNKKYEEIYLERLSK